MLFTLFSVALFVAASIRGVSAAFAINSPKIVQCQSTQISWEPTSAGNYNLIVAKGEDMCGDPLVEIGDFNTTITHWVAAIPAGTNVYLSVMDSQDREAWSDKITVSPSNDDSCLPGSGSSSSGSPAGSPGTSSSSSPSPSPTDLTPLGAANAGSLSGSAITARQASMPIIAIAGLAVVVSLL